MFFSFGDHFFEVLVSGMRNRCFAISMFRNFVSSILYVNDFVMFVCVVYRIGAKTFAIMLQHLDCAYESTILMLLTSCSVFADNRYCSYIDVHVRSCVRDIVAVHRSFFAKRAQLCTQ